MAEMTGLQTGLHLGCNRVASAAAAQEGRRVAFRVIYTRMLQPSRPRVAPHGCTFRYSVTIDGGLQCDSPNSPSSGRKIDAGARLHRTHRVLPRNRNPGPRGGRARRGEKEARSVLVNAAAGGGGTQGTRRSSARGARDASTETVGTASRPATTTKECLSDARQTPQIARAWLRWL
jgi:hypothetical protein